ncbi:hypothetical protein [Brachyspira aalborgi]|uniref:Lipoprotein n=1 Tax=Brachyspira aalborgi TaxID=29522 RepID=A0A5C8EG63_9SPIR|nr:hypothetical protein [Brachyspira aalborgi]TXJ35971.1 hypothetical protein EPJ78_08240 [Brachyspira aalborgi]
MKEQIKNFYLLLIILSLIALFLISCDNKDKTGTEKRTLSYYAGNWWGKPDGATETKILIINTDGSVTLKGATKDAIIPSSSVTRVSDMIYTASHTISGKSAKSTFIFTSDTQGKFTMGLDGQSETIDITKK